MTSGLVLIIPTIRSTAAFIALSVGVEPPSSTAGNAPSIAVALSSAGATWISCGHSPVIFIAVYMPAHIGAGEPMPRPPPPMIAPGSIVPS